MVAGDGKVVYAHRIIRQAADGRGRLRQIDFLQD
jgi:hypothetical protein